MTRLILFGHLNAKQATVDAEEESEKMIQWIFRKLEEALDI